MLQRMPHLAKHLKFLLRVYTEMELVGVGHSIVDSISNVVQVGSGQAADVDTSRTKQVNVIFGLEELHMLR